MITVQRGIFVTALILASASALAGEIVCSTPSLTGMNDEVQLRVSLTQEGSVSNFTLMIRQNAVLGRPTVELSGANLLGDPGRPPRGYEEFDRFMLGVPAPWGSMSYTLSLFLPKKALEESKGFTAYLQYRYATSGGRTPIQCQSR